MEVKQFEYGYDFITLFFEDGFTTNLAAEKMYKEYKRRGFEHMSLQRKNFMHIAGDVPHFHSDGLPNERYKYYSHFHIILPHKPKSVDWQLVHEAASRCGIEIPEGVETREVKK